MKIDAESTIVGYTVQAVENGKLKSAPNVGDKVLLMCGAACRTSSGSNVVQYQWYKQDKAYTNIGSTREHTVTVDTVVGSATYNCKVTNCGKPSQASVTLNVAGKIC